MSLYYIQLVCNRAPLCELIHSYLPIFHDSDRVVVHSFGLVLFVIFPSHCIDISQLHTGIHLLYRTRCLTLLLFCCFFARQQNTFSLSSLTIPSSMFVMSYSIKTLCEKISCIVFSLDPIDRQKSIFFELPDVCKSD